MGHFPHRQRTRGTPVTRARHPIVMVGLCALMVGEAVWSMRNDLIPTVAHHAVVVLSAVVMVLVGELVRVHMPSGRVLAPISSAVGFTLVSLGAVQGSASFAVRPGVVILCYATGQVLAAALRREVDTTGGAAARLLSVGILVHLIRGVDVAGRTLWEWQLVSSTPRWVVAAALVCGASTALVIERLLTAMHRAHTLRTSTATALRDGGGCSGPATGLDSPGHHDDLCPALRGGLADSAPDDPDLVPADRGRGIHPTGPRPPDRTVGPGHGTADGPWGARGHRLGVRRAPPRPRAGRSRRSHPERRSFGTDRTSPRWQTSSRPKRCSIARSSSTRPERRWPLESCGSRTPSTTSPGGSRSQPRFRGHWSGSTWAWAMTTTPRSWPSSRRPSHTARSHSRTVAPGGWATIDRLSRPGCR